MRGTLWSDEEVKILKELAEKKVSAKDMQLVLKGRTINAIRSKLDELGLRCYQCGCEIDYAMLDKIRKAVSKK
jgi:hypothetical protein